MPISKADYFGRKQQWSIGFDFSSKGLKTEHFLKQSFTSSNWLYIVKCCNLQAKLLIAEQNRKLEEVQKELARAKEEEELKLKETEQESVEAKEMKTKLSECRVESNKVGGEEKLWRRRVKDTAAELANSEAELTKMKSTVEAASAENAKLAEENKSLSQTFSNLQAEADAVRKKKMNFGEELSLVTQAQAEKMRQASLSANI